MIIEIADFLIHLNRLGLLIVCFAIWLVVSELLPPDKRAHWITITTSGFGKLVNLFSSLLFVCGVFYYTVILFFASTLLLQSIASYVGLPGRLNFMLIIVALPIASMLQVYTMRYISKTGVTSAETPDQDSEKSVSTIRWGTVLFSMGFFLQFLATFG
jgi:hypothetical protein